MGILAVQRRFWEFGSFVVKDRLSCMIVKFNPNTVTIVKNDNTEIVSNQMICFDNVQQFNMLNGSSNSS